jgi:hypothetical protein
MVMSGINIGGVNITGTGFTPQSQVLFDGVPTVFSLVVDSQNIEGQINGPSLGVHQISVQNGSQVSNSLPFTYYDPRRNAGPDLRSVRNPFVCLTRPNIRLRCHPWSCMLLSLRFHADSSPT